METQQLNARGVVNCAMIGHERFGVRFLDTTTKAKFYVQNAFCHTSDWTLQNEVQMSRLLHFRMAVGTKTHFERTLNAL